MAATTFTKQSLSRIPRPQQLCKLIKFPFKHALLRTGIKLKLVGALLIQGTMRIQERKSTHRTR